MGYLSNNLPPGVSDTDPMAPWNQVEGQECCDCDGSGHLSDSECCGADLNNSLCMACKEHAEGEECETCEGSGEVRKEDQE